MEYISGIHALNLPCSLETCGDWHTSSLNWVNIDIRNTDDLWGIECNKSIPESDKLFNVANDLRAIYDLLSDGKVRYLKNFKNDFIGTDKYNFEFFTKVKELESSKYWQDINNLMKSEFMQLWIDFRKGEC